MLNNKNKRLVR